MLGLTSVSASRWPGCGLSLFITTFGLRTGGGATSISDVLLRNLPGESLPDMLKASRRFPRLLLLELAAELILKLCFCRYEKGLKVGAAFNRFCFQLFYMCTIEFLTVPVNPTALSLPVLGGLNAKCTSG